MVWENNNGLATVKKCSENAGQRSKDRNPALAKLKPSELLKEDNPRLIGEWQVAPQLWDSVRLSVDLRNETGLYILTGSTTVNTDNVGNPSFMAVITGTEYAYVREDGVFVLPIGCLRN